MTRIVTDTTSGLAPGLCQELGIPLIPQIIAFGEESFREGVDIDHAEFMRRLRTGPTMPKTAAPLPGDFIAAFNELGAGRESIVCIHPSSDLSGTVRSAETARHDFQGADIRIIDTRTVASPLAAMVLEADRMAKAGASADVVEARVREMGPRSRIYFLVDTLEFLVRGGRIGAAQALVGSVLQIKPILALWEGRIIPHEKPRTKKHAITRLKELTLSEADRDGDAHVAVMHSAAQAEAEALASELAAALRLTSVEIMDLVPAIVTHAGPGALAVGFFASGK